MAIGTAAAMIGSAVVGGVMQGRAASKAARSNQAQQQASLAFQEKQIQRGLKELDKGFTFAREGTLAQMEKTRRETDAAIAARGYDPTSTMALGAKRAAASDAAGQLQQLYANISQSKAALYGGQSFPMIMQQGPQGNWAGDFARMASMIPGGGGPSAGQMAVGGMGMQAAGQAMAQTPGMGMFGTAMQAAGSGMTSAAMGG